MKLKWEKPRLQDLAGMKLKPGLNDVDDDVFEEALEHRKVKHYFESGDLAVVEEGSGGTDEGGKDAGPVKMTVAELEAAIVEADVETVQAYLEAEQARDKPRPTALAALESRLEELTAPPDGGTDEGE